MLFTPIGTSFAEKENAMKNRIERAYEEYAFMACGILSHERKVHLLRKIRACLGGASDTLDNMIYERTGMSAEEALEMFEMDATLV